MEQKETTPITDIMNHCDKLLKEGHKSLDVQGLKDWCETKLIKQEKALLEKVWDSGFSNGLH